MAPLPDAATVLTTLGPLATKVVGPGPDGRLGVLEPYGSAEHFRATTAVFHGLADVLTLLGRLASCPRSFLIRGEPLAWADRRRCKRLLHPKREDDGRVSLPTFRAAARRWIALDLDGLEPPAALAGTRWLDRPAETAAFLAASLPAGFAGAACILQATASAAVKPGIRARLWCWLDRPVSDAEACRWLADAPVDRSLFRAVQPHYTAAPVFRGCADPLPRRLWLVPAAREAVPVPDLPEPPPRAPVPAAPRRPSRDGSAYARAALARECEAVAATPPGRGADGRHAALNRAAFKLARFLRSGELGSAELVSSLLWAARRAGLEDGDEELRRFLRYPLRAGAERAGAG